MCKNLRLFRDFAQKRGSLRDSRFCHSERSPAPHGVQGEAKNLFSPYYPEILPHLTAPQNDILDSANIDNFLSISIS